MPTVTSTILALDVGQVRIGLAMTLPSTTIAKPHGWLENNDNVMDGLSALIEEHKVTELVVGLPRGLDGQETAQTAYVRDFVGKLADLKLPVHLQDEALTSHHGEEQLKQQGKSYQKGDIDAQAASIILQDYLSNQPGPA